LTFGVASPVSVGLAGSMQFEWSQTDLQTALRVQAAPSDDLRVVVSDGVNPSITESIRQPDLSKTLKYDEARAIVSMTYRYESQAFLGSVGVSTPQPLRAYLGTYPEAGRIELAGAAGSKLVLTPNFTTNSDRFQLALDRNGDGATDFSDTLHWTESTVGYLWWDGTTPLSWGSPTIYARNFSTTDFFAVVTLKWETATSSTVRVQFTRPLAATTPALYFRFVDQGSSPYDGTPLTNVAATSDIHGAIVIVRPVQPLRHARYYGLEVSLDGVNWSSEVMAQDTLGNSSSSYQWVGRSLVTPDNLRAVVAAEAGVLLAASDRLNLSGTASVSTSRTIVAYHWSQVSGSPLAFDAPEAAQTHVFWGATPPSGVQDAVVQLTVTDSAGDTDTTLVSVQSANIAGAAHVLYFRSASGDYIGGGRTVVASDGSGSFSDVTPYTGTFFMQFNGSGGNAGLYRALIFGTVATVPLTTGAYENAARIPNAGQSNVLEFAGDSRNCSQTSGRFDVLELQTDAAGNYLKLAVDFEQHCESASAPPLFGSYRINSTIPIRR
jgi:hypothetical protein